METKKENEIYERLTCGFTLCMHNASCCITPASYKKNYCKIATEANEVGLQENKKLNKDDDSRYIGCNKFVLNEKKIAKCIDCQIEEYGEVSIPLLNMEINYSALKENIEDMIEDGDDDFFDE